MINNPVTSLRRTRLRRSAQVAIAAVIPLLSGCATPPGAVFEPASGTNVWPPPPDEPRIRFVGQIRGQSDLRPGKTGFEQLSESLFGSKPTESFVSPMAVCTDGAQRVFIADSNAQAVHVLDLGSRAYQKLAPTDPDQRLTFPVAVAYDPAGRLLVADSVGGQIVVFDAAGNWSGVIGAGVLQRPCGVAIDPVKKRIFVADAAAHQIVVFDDQGKETSRIGRRGSEPGEFNYPTNVALDKSGHLYVSDSLNFRVQVFGPNLEPIRQIGRKGDMPGYFSQPKGISLDPAGHLYVVDANFEAVQVFDAEGTLLMSFGHEGHGPGEFWLPSGMFIDPAGRIWIADSYNRRVQVFDYLPEGKSP